MGKTKKQILVIDDEESIYMALKMTFKDRYQLYYAKNGVEGCEKAKTIKPDLIILDSRMGGVSGEATLFNLRQQDDKVPIVFLTAYPEDVISQIGNLGNVSSFVDKPFNAAALRQLVNNLLQDCEF
jgi:DNA-binding response OmpR family regulator